MIDIQSDKFIETFNVKDGIVGQIGYGFIGNAVVELFRPYCRVVVYDKAGYDGRPDLPNVDRMFALDSVVNQAEIIFVAVPTPMSADGSCYTGVLEDVLQNIQNVAARLERDLGSFIVVIKSTVPPGFTKKMQDRLALRIVFSPEFLTEKNAVQDFKKTNRVILGGDLEDARVVFKYFEGVWPDRMMENFSGHPDGVVHILQCSSTVAEMVKLSTNAHLASRVMISNELFLICQKIGVDYDDVKRLTQCDPRIGITHMDVPGPDGQKAYGGSCFVKDVQNLNFVSKSLGETNNLFNRMHERCVELRPEKDWEELKGRAVV